MAKPFEFSKPEGSCGVMGREGARGAVDVCPMRCNTSNHLSALIRPTAKTGKYIQWYVPDHLTGCGVHKNHLIEQSRNFIPLESQQFLALIVSHPSYSHFGGNDVPNRVAGDAGVLHEIHHPVGPIAWRREE